MSPVDLLVFGPHPDDIEIGMGGTVAVHAAHGSRVGLVDLTRGELGSNGTPEERVAEGEAACRVLGASWRENLGLPDGNLALTEDNRRAVAEVVRLARPQVVAIPHARDRHPDHVAAHALLRRALFDSGLARFRVGGEPWRPARIVEYFINDLAEVPTLVVDVSRVYETKRAALACYATQFAPRDPSAVATRLTSPLFAQLIESRDAQFGAQAGVRHAEGFVVREPLPVADLVALGRSATVAAEPRS